MRRIKASSENEMILEFLKMEFDSERFNAKIEAVLKEMCINSDIISNGNIVCEQENVLRAEILKRFRGYRDKEIFENFPANIEWIWTEFDREDIFKILYIEYSYWNELSNYTGSPLEAAKTIISGKMIYDVPNDRAINGANKLKEGHIFPPLIFLTDENERRYIVLEGHSRITAYGLVPDLFQNVSVLLGVCERKDLEKWYGKMPVRFST